MSIVFLEISVGSAFLKGLRENKV